MIQAFVDRFIAGKQLLLDDWTVDPPTSYDAIVKQVVTMVANDDCGAPDPERITAIDHGDYQGTRVFVIGCTGYQPNRYWYVRIGYGSCSGCDAFQDLQDKRDAAGFVTLALHIVQGMKQMDDEVT